MAPALLHKFHRVDEGEAHLVHLRTGEGNGQQGVVCLCGPDFHHQNRQRGEEVAGDAKGHSAQVLLCIFMHQVGANRVARADGIRIRRGHVQRGDVGGQISHGILGLQHRQIRGDVAFQHALRMLVVQRPLVRRGETVGGGGGDEDIRPVDGFVGGLPQLTEGRQRGLLRRDGGVGGFVGGDISDPYFKELLVRWFAWGAFCPVFRMHGERSPWYEREQEFINNVRQLTSGQDNEVWSFGEDNYEILTKYLFIREKLRPYIRECMKQASETGAPVMRPMFFDFPEDKKEEYKQLVEGENIRIFIIKEKDGKFFKALF